MEQFIEPSDKLKKKACMQMHFLLLSITFNTSGFYGSYSMI